MATSDLPDPVGVARTTWAPLTNSISASSWCGYSTVPFASAQAANELNSSSGSAPRARRGARSDGSSRRGGAGPVIVGNSVPDGPSLPGGDAPVRAAGGRVGEARPDAATRWRTRVRAPPRVPARPAAGRPRDAGGDDAE